MRQYEVWWARLPEPARERPVLLLSRNGAYEYLQKVLVVEITSKVRNIPVEVPLGKSEGLDRSCVANCDNIRTLPVSRLLQRAGALKQRRWPEVKRAVGYALGWEELITLRVSGQDETK